ncbi:MAG: peptidylprolyl isomerase [Pseudomonadota bacterium]
MPSRNVHAATRADRAASDCIVDFRAIGCAALAAALLTSTYAFAAPGKLAHAHRGHLTHTAVAQPEAQPAAADSSPVVARMGNVALHADEVQKLVASLGAADRSAIASDPKVLARVLSGMIANRFLLDEALAKHWQDQPAVAAALVRMRDNAIVQSYLESVAVPSEDFPSEADIEAAYNANKAALVSPPGYDVAQIFIAAKDGADQATEDKAREKILAIAHQLRQPGSDFAAIARANSESKATAPRGGEIGWLTEAQMRPDIKPHILGLAKGQVTEPLRLDDGWQILKLLDSRPAGTLTLDQVRGALKQRLRQQRAAELQRAYIAALLKANPISVNPTELKNLVGATGEAAQSP